MCKELCEHWKGRGEEGGGGSATWKFYLDIPAGIFFSPPPPWKGGGRGEGSERMLKGSVFLWNLPLHFFFLSFCPSRSRSRSRSRPRSRARGRMQAGCTRLDLHLVRSLARLVVVKGLC